MNLDHNRPVINASNGTSLVSSVYKEIRHWMEQDCANEHEIRSFLEKNDRIQLLEEVLCSFADLWKNRSRSSRRLPVYLLLDTSGSMRGDPIEAVKVGLEAMLSCLQRDPVATSTVFLSIITFDREVKMIVPMQPVSRIAKPNLMVPDTGPTHLGEALAALCREFDLSHQKDDHDALLFVMTDGSPSDLGKYREYIPKVKERGFSKIICCAAGSKAKTDELMKLSSHVIVLDTMLSSDFKRFFDEVLVSIREESWTENEDLLPGPPPEIVIVT